MLDITSAWLYSDTVSDARRTTLGVPASFEELIALAKDEIREIRVCTRHGYDPGLTDCIQPIFSFELPSTGDPLFNGPYGYRAQFWRSPLEGLRANAMLLAALTPKLLAVADIGAVPELGKIDVCASLRASSAKFWIQELPSLLLNPTVDLKVERWCNEAQRGVQLAKWGLSAPEVSKFDVKVPLSIPTETRSSHPERFFVTTTFTTMGSRRGKRGQTTVFNIAKPVVPYCLDKNNSL